MQEKMKKPDVEHSTSGILSAYAVYAGSDRAGNLTGTQATGAGVDITGAAVHNRLNPDNIRFPSSVRTPMGMGNLNTEGNTLSTDIAFCHESAPPFH